MGYKDDFYKSRYITKYDKIQCEHPCCINYVQDIHHLTPSMRGPRSHNKDGSDLIGLCRHHHEIIHNHNTIENREMLLDRVDSILTRKNKLWLSSQKN